MGVGRLTVASMVAETAPLRAGATPAQVVADAWRDPAPHRSGRSVRGAGRIRTTGAARLKPEFREHGSVAGQFSVSPSAAGAACRA